MGLQKVVLLVSLLPACLLTGCKAVEPGVAYPVSIHKSDITIDNLAWDELLKTHKTTIEASNAIYKDIVDAFKELNVANKILTERDSSLGNHGSGLITKIRIRRVKHGDWELSSSWTLSGALWLVTWIGGLYIEDRTYDARLSIEFEFYRKNHKQSFDCKVFESDAISLDFWERNPLVSWGVIQSFILPPFWTSHHEMVTYNQVLRRGIFEIVGKVKQYLMEQYPTQSELNGNL